ncbi:MAG: hypothetical protein K2J38_05380 [Muribaculaceae bacterium]|nr:hypothetical protein [Muribaculaceae bacterium]
MTESEVRILIAKFLDGSSTPEEERSVYGWFAQNADAGDLEEYRQMFDWYAALEATAPAADRNELRRRRRGKWLAAAGIAASVALMAGIIAPFALSPGADYDSELYATLEGSYVSRGGKTVTDIRLIYDDLIRAEQFADSLQSELDSRDIDAELQEQILASVTRDISDPVLAESVRRDILESF